MNNKDKLNHVAKAATKASRYEVKAAYDKADIYAALVAYQVARSEKKNDHLLRTLLPQY